MGLRFTREYNFLWVEPFTALHRVSGIRPVLTHKYLHLKTQNSVIMEFHKRSVLHGASLESVVDAIVLAMDAGPTDPVSVDR